MKDRIHIGMIGCGQIMPEKAKAILASQHCRMCALHDIDIAAARQRSNEFGVPLVEDLWEFLAYPGMDAVYIAVPHGWHVPLAVEAARAGKHIMLEKPMVTDIDDGRLLLAECEKAGVKLSVAMTMRFDDIIQQARQAVMQGLIGDVVSIQICSIGFKGKEYWSNGVGGRARRSAWRAFKSMAGGGILIMNAVHNLDALYYITGLKPVEVVAMGGTYKAAAAVEDAISILVHYDKSSAYGVCNAMSCAYGANHIDDMTIIYGTKGTLRLGGKLELFTSVEGGGFETGKLVNVPTVETDDCSAMMDDFAMAILEDKQPTVTGEDGLMIADLILSAYRSMKTNTVERLETTGIWL